MSLFLLSTVEDNVCNSWIDKEFLRLFFAKYLYMLKAYVNVRETIWIIQKNKVAVVSSQGQWVILAPVN